MSRCIPNRDIEDSEMSECFWQLVLLGLGCQGKRWRQPLDGTQSRLTAIVHELSMFLFEEKAIS